MAAIALRNAYAYFLQRASKHTFRPGGNGLQRGDGMRFLLRFASFLALVLGVLVASVDAIQSVSASEPVLTPLVAALEAGGPSTQSLVQSLERSHGDGTLLDPLIRWALQQPAFAFFLIIALGLWMIGYKRAPAAGRFSA